jgi:TRAP transporter TAXI family solute receptor
MLKLSNLNLHRLLVAFMGLVLIGSVFTWYLTRDALPSTLRIATGRAGGLYNEFGQGLGEAWTSRSGHEYERLPSEGSGQNRAWLLEGKVDVALLQGGAVPTDGLAIIAPLYSDIVHVIARTNSGIERIEDLAGRTVVLGPDRSGMRPSAHKILEHYGLENRIQDAEVRYFRDFLGNETVEAALVTTGVLNRDLREVLDTGRFRLLPITDARAIEMKDFFLYRTAIPRGLYREAPPVPRVDTESVGATAYLAVRQDASDSLIRAILGALHEEGLSQRFPTLIPHNQALLRSLVPLHSAARQYFNPPDQIGELAKVLESIAATKELLFALAAGSFLVWDRYRRLKENERLRIVQHQKEHLDAILEKTLLIEQAQLGVYDSEILTRYLDDVTKLKLEALHGLTDESLRSDRAFLIFIVQCANLINKIQFKIAQTHRPKDAP